MYAIINATIVRPDHLIPNATIVIEDGKIAEQGSHLDLLAQKGIYHKLFGLQMAAMRNIGIEES